MTIHAGDRRAFLASTTLMMGAACMPVAAEAQTEKKIEGTLLLGDLEAVIVDQRDSA